MDFKYTSLKIKCDFFIIVPSTEAQFYTTYIFSNEITDFMHLWVKSSNNKKMFSKKGI